MHWGQRGHRLRSARFSIMKLNLWKSPTTQNNLRSGIRDRVPCDDGAGAGGVRGRRRRQQRPQREGLGAAGHRALYHHLPPVRHPPHRLAIIIIIIITIIIIIIIIIMTRLEHEPCPIPGSERHQRVLGAPLGLLAGAACRGRGGCPHLPAHLPGLNSSVLHYVNKCSVLHYVNKCPVLR